MTLPCPHCRATPVTRHLTTTVPGATPVTLGLCRCDYLTCISCGQTVYDRAARRCAHCGKDPAIKS